MVAFENNGYKTAYYFGVPIYNNKSRRLLDLKFSKNGNTSYLIGSNALIEVTDTIDIKNQLGACRVSLPGKYIFKNEHCIAGQKADLFPTTNGIACKVRIEKEKPFIFHLHTQKAFYQIKNNGKYFALMKEKFTPFLTISCIGSMNSLGEIIAPATITYQKHDDKDYDVFIKTTSPNAATVLFEINLQEQKLIQDTTVESKNPKSNNAFGGTAFIGNSNTFGEQWLYSRPDYCQFQDLFSSSIQSVVLYTPVHNQNHLRLTAYGLSNRFCSFGSNWNNKKTANQIKSVSEYVTGYQKIDLTKMMVQEKRLLTKSEGWILKSTVKNSGFSVISTGDSFFAPQILEIKFKN